METLPKQPITNIASYGVDAAPPVLDTREIDPKLSLGLAPSVHHKDGDSPDGHLG